MHDLSQRAPRPSPASVAEHVRALDAAIAYLAAHREKTLARTASARELEAAEAVLEAVSLARRWLESRDGRAS